MSNWSRAKDAWIARECEGLHTTALFGTDAGTDYGGITAQSAPSAPSSEERKS